jgi:hypothetical protein
LRTCAEALRVFWNPMKCKAMATDVRTRIIYGALAIMTIMFSMGKDLMAQTSTSTVVKNIVFVHGGFVDGSGWQGVYKALKKDGYTVTIVQNPTISLPEDVAPPSARSPRRTAP